MDFGQSVDGFCQQVRGGMRSTVKLLVDRGIVEPEVGAEVDHPETLVEKGDGIIRGGTVGQGQKGDGGSAGGHRLHVRLDEGQVRAGEAGEAGKDLLDPLPGIGPGSDRGETGGGVGEQEPDQLHAGISARAENGDLGGFHGGVAGDGRKFAACQCRMRWVTSPPASFPRFCHFNSGRSAAW